MKILVWSINYAPEATGIAPCNVALCEYLRSQGHEVEMVTTFAYYPMWAKRPEDCGLLYRTDLMNGVPVHRCWHYVPAKVKAWKRIVHEASFVATSFVRVLSCRRPDVMVVVSPPLLLGAAAWIVSAVRKVPFIFHVQDLQPDAAIGLGMLKTGPVSRVLYGLVYLGNLDAKRDWGYAPEFVEGMGRMLQQEQGDDYVLATNETHTVREFCDEAFAHVGLNCQEHVKYDARYERPAEVELLIGSFDKAWEKLGWEPETKFQDLVRTMVDADLAMIDGGKLREPDLEVLAAVEKAQAEEMAAESVA